MGKRLNQSMIDIQDKQNCMDQSLLDKVNILQIDIQKNFDEFQDSVNQEICNKNEDLVLRVNGVEEENKQVVRDFTSFESLINKYNDYFSDKNKLDNDLKLKQEQISAKLNIIDERILAVESINTYKFENVGKGIDELLNEKIVAVELDYNYKFDIVGKSFENLINERIVEIETDYNYKFGTVGKSVEKLAEDFKSNMASEVKGIWSTIGQLKDNIVKKSDLTDVQNNKSDAMKDDFINLKKKFDEIQQETVNAQESFKKYEDTIINFKESEKKVLGMEENLEKDIKNFIQVEIQKVSLQIQENFTTLVEKCDTDEVQEKSEIQFNDFTQKISDLSIKTNTEFCEHQNQLDYCYNRLMNIDQVIEDKIKEQKDLEYSIFTEEEDGPSISNVKTSKIKGENLMSKIITFESKFEKKLAEVEKTTTDPGLTQKFDGYDYRFANLENEIYAVLQNKILNSEMFKEALKECSPAIQKPDTRRSSTVLSPGRLESDKKIINNLEGQFNPNISIFKSKNEDYSFNMAYNESDIEAGNNQNLVRRVEILEEEFRKITEHSIKKVYDKSLMDEVKQELNKTKDEMGLWLSRISKKRTYDSKGVSQEQSLTYDNRVGISSHLSPHDSRAVELLGDQEHGMKLDFSQSHFSIDRLEHDKSVNDMQKDLNRMITFVHDLGNKQAMKVVEKLNNSELGVNEKQDSLDWLAKNIRQFFVNKFLGLFRTI